MAEQERTPNPNILANRPIIVEEEPSSSSPDDTPNNPVEDPVPEEAQPQPVIAEQNAVSSSGSATSNPFSRWASTIMSKVSSSVTSSPAKSSPGARAAGVSQQSLAESMATAEMTRPVEPGATGAIPKTCSQNSTPTKKQSASPHLSSRSSSR